MDAAPLKAKMAGVIHGLGGSGEIFLVTEGRGEYDDQ